MKVQAGGGGGTVAATVTGQHIFYNNSFFDFDSDPTTSPFGSGDLAANANDDHAVATDKTPCCLERLVPS